MCLCMESQKVSRMEISTAYTQYMQSLLYRYTKLTGLNVFTLIYTANVVTQSLKLTENGIFQFT